MLLRRIARPLLASAFLVDGITVLIHPEPLAKSKLATKISEKVSAEPVQLVRITAASRACGATLLAFGKAPRLGAFVLAATTIPVMLVEQDFWAENDADRRSAKQTAFVKDAGLLGGLLIAVGDTEGKPSLSWRGKRAARDAATAISAALPLGTLPAEDNLTHRAHDALETARALAERARNEATDLTDAARTHAPQWADAARSHVPQWTDAAKDRAADLGDRLSTGARESVPALADAARSRSTDLAEAARRHGGQLIEIARERGAELAETARHRLPSERWRHG